ncbi:uncharacterized protein LOC121425438 isoform X2 [Lytechinus variegatus]|nr:uncharacterized protein LOC121425438 isoform X2 [Lytechinus variegatus]XP_041477426.1 uncharacterized protein LOC121425438 isoform X2 [Lytechinus variegatus]
MSTEEVEMEKKVDLANGAELHQNGEKNAHTAENGDLPPVEVKDTIDKTGQNGVKSHEPFEATPLYKKQAPSSGFRWDVIGWLIGIVFVTALLLAMMFIGNSRGWDADAGYYHNESESSQERFLPEPYIEEPGVPGRYGSGASARWYYWQIPPEEVTALTRGIMWLCYVTHQLFVWGCIYYAQRSKTVYPNPLDAKYSTDMKNFNWIPLIGNMVFHLFHLGQTHWTYDALAQDVSEASSQGSVIMLLVFVLMIEYRNRGMAFGWPSKDDTNNISNKLRLPWGPQELIRRYHGYAFSWAAIYTFWYHPMENTVGHALGFTHTWLFMLQGSLMYTQFHLNRYWRLLLEAWVIIHGSVVAWQTGGPALNGTSLYPMFMFGFLWIFTMTQLFGLPIFKYIPRLLWFLPFVAYMAVGIYVYGWVFFDKEGRYWIRMNEMIRIPATEYLCVIIAWLVMWFFLWIEKKVKADRINEPFQPPSIVKEIMHLSGVVFTYAIMVTVAILIQALDVKMDLIALMVIFVIIFTVGVAVTCMLLKQIMPPYAGDLTDTSNNSRVSPTFDNPGFKVDEKKF